MAIAGLVTGIISIAAGIIFWVMVTVGIGSIGNAFSKLPFSPEQFYEQYEDEFRNIYGDDFEDIEDILENERY